MVSFLHPWILALGAAAATLPVVVHLLTRPRPVRMPLSTLRFVREAIRQQRARHRLRDFIVLALRTVAILLIAMALARPQWGQRPLVSEHQTGETVRVVIVDVSQSMSATQGGLANLERARTAASSYVRYRPGLRANLILAGATPHAVFDGASTNFNALGDALAKCRPLPERLGLNRSLKRAAEMLAPSGPGDTRRRELVVVSDFQRSGWADADVGVLPSDAKIQLVSVAPAADLDKRSRLDNVALLRAEFRGRTSQEQGAQLEVEIGNYTANARKVTVEVTIGGAAFRLSGVCPSDRRTVLSDVVQLPQAGWQTGVARLIGNEDVLAADDVRPLVIEVRRRPLYALITREVPKRRLAASHFLECALVPDESLGSRAASELVRVDPDAADRESLASADLLLLDHPGKLSEQTIQLLNGLMRRGRPLLYVTAEAIDGVNLKRLVEAVGGSSQMPVEFVPPPASSPRRDLFLASVERQRPPFAVFGDGVSELTRHLRFAGGLSSRKLPTGLSDDVLATYGDGTACLVLTSLGGATFGVLNADLAASSLPKTGPFVPFMEELVHEMVSRGAGAEGALCGEPLVLRLPAELTTAVGLSVRDPEPPAAESAPRAAPATHDAEATPKDAVQRGGRLVQEAQGVVWQWPAPDAPGAYAIERQGQTVFATAVNLPAEESQLDYLSADVLTGRLGGGRNVAYLSSGNSDDSRDDAWTWLLAGCTLAMLVEIGALAGFRT